MKLHQDSTDALNTVTAYDQGYIEINAKRHLGGVFFMPEGLVSPWDVSIVEELDAERVAELLGWQADIILLGTGARQRFPSPAHLAPIIQAGIGHEIMSTPAACRTYNILMAEGRQVMAAVLPILEGT